MVEAAIATLRWDLQSLHSAISSALNIAPQAVLVLLNATIFLGNVNDYESAIDFAKKAWLIAPNDELVCEHYLTSLLRIGLLREVKRLQPTLAVSASLKRAADSTLEVTILEELGLPDEHLRAELREAHAVLRERRIRTSSSNYRVQIDPDDGLRSLVYRIGYEGSPDDEEQLSADLAARLAGSGGWRPSEFTIDFVPIALYDELQFA